MIGGKVALVLLVVCVAAAWGGLLPPQQYQEPVPIVSYRSEQSPDGSFSYGYQSADGSSQEQSGHEGAPEGGSNVQGQVAYVDPDGNQHSLQYVADENGYQPQSADVPVGPEIPAHIIKALEWNAAHPEEETEQ